MWAFVNASINSDRVTFKTIHRLYMGDVRTLKNRLLFCCAAIFCYILFLRYLKLLRLVLRFCVIHRLIKKANEGFRSFQHETYLNTPGKYVKMYAGST